MIEEERQAEIRRNAKPRGAISWRYPLEDADAADEKTKAWKMAVPCPSFATLDKIGDHYTGHWWNVTWWYGYDSRNGRKT